jgi:uncharacterized protein YjbI with pentapeptide repeats
MQSEDLDKVKGAVVDSANMVRNIWVLFLSFGTYLVVAVGSVSDRQILLKEQIRLPLLNVPLPLDKFFLVAPVLFLIFHVYLLMHLKLMSDKVQRYNELVRKLVGEPDAKKTKEQQSAENQLRLQLPDFMFVQYLAGPGQGWKSLMHWLLLGIAWLTVAIGPVLLLLFIQLQFLRYHSAWISFAQRVFIFGDICLLWWFCPKILQTASQGGRFAKATKAVAAIFSPALIVFSFFIAVFPGEPIYGTVINRSATDFLSIAVSPVEATYRTVAGFLSIAIPPEKATGRTFARSRWIVPPTFFQWVFVQGWQVLNLQNEHLVDVNALEKITERKQKEADQGVSEYLLSLPERDLARAVLENADLRQVNLSGAQLEGAQLSYAHLQGAKLSGAHLEGASLRGASLQGADLSGAYLQGAQLDSANLQGAILSNAHLEGATLDFANLQAAYLLSAYLQGATLKSADLRGANLDSAELWGANLSCAQLDGALLTKAGLWRTFGKNDKNCKDDHVTIPRVWLKKPRLQRPSEQQLADWERNLQRVDEADQGVDVGAAEKRKWKDVLEGVVNVAVQGVDDDAAKNRVRDALARVLLPKQDLQDNLDDYWNDLANKASKEEDKPDLPDRLTTLACLDPFVARGLVTNYELLEEPSDLLEELSDDTGMEKFRPKLAATLMKAADENQCPGVKGITEVAMAHLRNWAAQVEK